MSQVIENKGRGAVLIATQSRPVPGRFLALLLAVGLALSLCFAAAPNVAAQAAAPAAAPAPGGTAAPAAKSPATPNPEFLRAADEVLSQMSALLHLPIKQPLKKTLRSKQEIRAYLIREEQEDKDEAQHYADRKALEAFGLIPKNFPLDQFMVDTLTEQVAGLYDPKAGEFYIADWIPADQQREVMSHELTHALEDQSFRIDPWIKGARPNDDAEMARDAVSEGSALAAMVDYVLREQHVTVRDLPDVTQMIRSSAVAAMDQDASLAKAPLYIRDGLMFPYLAGTSFSQQFLKAHAGWTDLKLLFERPPVSTQQILHPDLYLKNVAPDKVALPAWTGVVPGEWKLLEENVLGEFGLEEVLKQFLGPDRADRLSPAWAGDRYAVFENPQTKDVSLVLYLALDNDEDAARFFGQYSEALESKYATRRELYRRPNFFQFQTEVAGRGVFLRCVAAKCLTVEGASRESYNAIVRAIGWPPAPAPAGDAPAPSSARVRAIEKISAELAAENVRPYDASGSLAVK